MFPTLKYLELEVSDPDGIMESTHASRLYKQQSLILEIKVQTNLKFIVIPFSPRLNYIFLLKFPNLKEIKFVAEDNSMWNVNKSDIFPDLHEKICTNKLYESNIWNVFPKLQVVSVEWGDDYEDGEFKAVPQVDFHRFDYNQHQRLLLGGKSQTEEKEEFLGTEGEIEDEASASDLLKQYEALKCAGCDEVIGYRDRTSGVIYCAGRGHPFGCFVPPFLDELLEAY